jgi:uncharacterized protein (DUF1697 family)
VQQLKKIMTKITYIALLRGINVSGKNIIKMNDLKTMFLTLDTDNVRTYIQSGNVIFESKILTANELQPQISAQIQATFGFDVPVLVYDLAGYKKIIDANPYSNDADKDVAHLHINFLSVAISSRKVVHYQDKILFDEQATIIKNAVYLYCPNGYGKTKLHNKYWENKLKCTATTRNFKTAQELLKIAESL